MPTAFPFPKTCCYILETLEGVETCNIFTTLTIHASSLRAFSYRLRQVVRLGERHWFTGSGGFAISEDTNIWHYIILEGIMRWRSVPAGEEG